MTQHRCSSSKLYQVGILSGFLDCVYEGDVTIEALSRQGDFGIGTFDRVHGELIAFDGNFYRIAEDGVAHKAPPAMKTPFAWVVPFEETFSLTLRGIRGFKTIEDELNQHFDSLNYIYGYRMTGRYSFIEYRTECEQPKPYRPLSETLEGVTQNFSLQQCSGTVVGFIFPPYLNAVNIGFHHMHFIDQGLTTGGHVFDFGIEEVQCSVSKIKKFELNLIESAAFSEFDSNNSDLAKFEQQEKGS